MAEEGGRQLGAPIPVKAAFIGFAELGPTDEPVGLSTWNEFEETFGARSDLAFAARGWFDNGGGDCVILRLDGYSDDDPRDVLGSGRRSSGFVSLAARHDVDLVACPSLSALASRSGGDPDPGLFVALQRDLVEACAQAGDRLALLDPPQGLSPEACWHWREESGGYDSPFAVLYYPWIRVMEGERLVSVPSCGQVAGVYASAARTGDLLQPPANVRLRGTLDVDSDMNSLELGELYRRGINVFLARAHWGVRPSGSRTLSDDGLTRDVGRVRILARMSRELAPPTDGTVSSDEADRVALDGLRGTWSRLAGGRPSPPVSARTWIGGKVLTLHLGGGAVAHFSWAAPGPWRWSVRQEDGS